MSHPSKAKGNAFERELVNDARSRGIEAERAYASNGKALGCAESVDLVVAGCRVQAKRRKALPAYLKVPEGADVVCFREDRGQTWALLKWDDLRDMIAKIGW